MRSLAVDKDVTDNRLSYSAENANKKYAGQGDEVGKA